MTKNMKKTYRSALTEAQALIGYYAEPSVIAILGARQAWRQVEYYTELAKYYAEQINLGNE